MSTRQELVLFLDNFTYQEPGQTAVTLPGTQLAKRLPYTHYLRICDRRYGDDLYVLRYDFRSDSLKIGRSFDVLRRANDLERCHDFRVVLLLVLPGMGWVESLLHARLRHLRASSGSGKEWFTISLAEVLQVLIEIYQDKLPT